MSSFDIAGMLAVIVAMIGIYNHVMNRIKATEDCVESEMKCFGEALNDFKLEVTNRLTAIETAIKKNSEK